MDTPIHRENKLAEPERDDAVMEEAALGGDSICCDEAIGDRAPTPARKDASESTDKTRLPPPITHTDVTEVRIRRVGTRESQVAF